MIRLQWDPDTFAMLVCPELCKLCSPTSQNIEFLLKENRANLIENSKFHFSLISVYSSQIINTWKWAYMYTYHFVHWWLDSWHHMTSHQHEAELPDKPHNSQEFPVDSPLIATTITTIKARNLNRFISTLKFNCKNDFILQSCWISLSWRPNN